jgi:hypothetical protein
VDVSDNDEASDPFRTPATTYQYTEHHIPQVKRLPWAGMEYFRAEINFDRTFHIFHPTSTNIGGYPPVMPLRNSELHENRGIPNFAKIEKFRTSRKSRNSELRENQEIPNFAKIEEF